MDLAEEEEWERGRRPPTPPAAFEFLTSSTLTKKAVGSAGYLCVTSAKIERVNTWDFGAIPWGKGGSLATERAHGASAVLKGK